MTPYQNKTHILFDFDNTITLLDLDWNAWHVGVGEIFRKYEPTFHEHLEGKHIRPFQNNMFRTYGKPLKREVDDFNRMYEEKFTKGQFPVIKTIELIKALYASGKKLSIWSSNDSSTVKKWINVLQILPMFELIVGREMVEYIKPDADGYFKYFQKSDARQHVLMVGDSENDKGAAEKIEMDYLDVKNVGSFP